MNRFEGQVTSRMDGSICNGICRQMMSQIDYRHEKMKAMLGTKALGDSKTAFAGLVSRTQRTSIA